MRKLLLLLMFIPSVIFAQDYPYKSEIVSAEGMTAVDIYLKAKEWYATAFNSAQDVIQMDERGETLIAKGIFHSYFTTVVMGSEYNIEMNIYFTLTTKFKEGKYKYDLVITGVDNNAGAALVSYTEYIDSSTEEGYDKLIASKGVKVGKKARAKSIASSKQFCNNVSVEADALISNLKDAISKADGDDSW